MPKITTSPDPTPPGTVIAIAGEGFANAKTRLLLDGAGATSNIFRPRRDGTFSVGITVATSPRTQTLIAQQASGKAWPEVARTTVAVANVTPPEPIPPKPPTGAVFYATNDGTGDGTILNPMSIQRFIDMNPPAGTTLYVRGGNYTKGGLTARDTYGSLLGTAAAPITIAAMPGEVVSFPDVPGTVFAFQANDTSHRLGVSYVVLDGLAFPNVKVSDEAAIVIGGHEPLYLVRNVTIRNCTGSIATSSASVDHIIGLIKGCQDTIVEDCTFSGGGQGDAFVVYDLPAALRTIIRRSTFTDFARAPIQVWDYAAPPTAGIAIEGCTFRRNVQGIDLRFHAASSVTGCSFDVPDGSRAIYDPNFAALTTKSGNLYNQTT